MHPSCLIGIIVSALGRVTTCREIAQRGTGDRRMSRSDVMATPLEHPPSGFVYLASRRSSRR